MQAIQSDSTLRQVMSNLLLLQNDELEIVSVLIERIKTSRSSSQRPSVIVMRAEAKRRATAMGDVPRAELASRLIKLVDEIRAEAIAKGTAIEGEWERD